MTEADRAVPRAPVPVAPVAPSPPSVPAPSAPAAGAGAQPPAGAARGAGATSFADFIAKNQRAALVPLSDDGQQAAAQAPTRPDPAAGLPRLDRDDAAALWQLLNQHCPGSLRALLTQMRCQGLDAETLATTSPAESVAMVEKVVVGPLGEIASKIMGRRLTVTVRADSTLKAMMPTEATRPAPVVIDPAVLADPLVRKAQELLSARIVGVRPRRDP
jgi:hypothetical protein